MKKITLLAFSIFAFIATTFAQNIQNPTAVEFTTNPVKYNGATISISGVKLNPKSSVSTVSVAPPSGAITAGAGTPGTLGNSSNTMRCTAPRGFYAIDIDFPNNPSFQKCFFISGAQFNSLPKTQDGLNASIMFKGDDKNGYTITLFKLL
jgi:hypothetical protein